MYDVAQPTLVKTVEDLLSLPSTTIPQLIRSGKSARTLLPLSRHHHGSSKVTLSSLPDQLKSAMDKVVANFGLVHVRLDLENPRPVLDIKWTLSSSSSTVTDSSSDEDDNSNNQLVERTVASFLASRLKQTGKKVWQSLTRQRRKEQLVLEARAVLPYQLHQSLASELNLPQTHLESLERLLVYAKTFQGRNTPVDLQLTASSSVEPETHRQKVELHISKLQYVASDEIRDVVRTIEREEKWASVQESFHLDTAVLKISMLVKLPN